jgi:hypothetical protein
MTVSGFTEWRYVIATSPTQGWTLPFPVWRFGGATNQSGFPLLVDTVIPVSAGSNTIYLNLDNYVGGTSSENCSARLTLLFTPSELP